MDVHARKFDDVTRTFYGVTVHSAEVHIFAREAQYMLEVVSDALVIARVSHCACRDA